MSPISQNIITRYKGSVVHSMSASLPTKFNDLKNFNYNIITDSNFHVEFWISLKTLNVEEKFKF